MAKLVCTQCGTVGKPKTTTRGSILIEIVLWLACLLPGIIYTLWRLTTHGKACRKCGSPNLVPVNSPAGQNLTGQV